MTQTTTAIGVRHRRLLEPFQRWWSYRDLVRNLVSKEIKVRYQGAALGFAWSLLNPLMITLMYLIVFTYVFKSSQPHHALYLVTGIVHWSLFATLATQGAEQLVSNSDLLKKIYFPRLLVPLANLLVNSVLWFMALGIFLMLYGPMGGSLHWALLAYPFYLLMFLVFMFGLNLILCVLYVNFRDIKHLVEVLVQLFFWMTPIVYSIDMLSKHVRELFIMSPLTEFISIFQTIFWAGRFPSWKITLAFAAWTLLSLGVGLSLFYRRGPKLIERL